jgi:hypothetical protein
MTSEMELVVDAGGGVRCIYDEALDLREIGKLQITRASHVEPHAEGYWWADMGPSGGPVLGPFRSRTKALGAEREWLSHRGMAYTPLPTATGSIVCPRPTHHQHRCCLALGTAESRGSQSVADSQCGTALSRLHDPNRA